MATKQLTVSCHCGTVTHEFHVPTSSLPLSSHLCSCDISRRISGSLLTSYINITHPAPSNPHPTKPDTSKCTAYNSSNILRRWFCAKCGTHMYLEYHADGHFEAATGTLQDMETDEVVKFESCMWIDDTKDGGASVWIQDIDGRELDKWIGEAGKSEKLPLTYPQKTSSAPEQNATNAPDQDDENSPIYAHCHCKGVEFWITKPDTTVSLDAASPFPDLMIPHHLQDPGSANTENEPWWLQHDGTRYMAGTCTCHSCRRASGFDITFWAFVPSANILLSPPHSAQHTRTYEFYATPFPAWNGNSPFPAFGTMRTYNSSPGVTRTFCSVCGANIFWAGDQARIGRKELLDVAVGLLDAKSGARAEEVLAWWTGRVSFAEDAVHRGLLGGLEAGLKRGALRNMYHE